MYGSGTMTQYPVFRRKASGDTFDGEPEAVKKDEQRQYPGTTLRG